MQPEFIAGPEVRRFISGQTVYSFHPATGELVATLYYQAGGKCNVHFVNGDVDYGTYGFSNQLYWTRYENFRSGRKHEFYLEKVDRFSMQAYHEDGSKAYLLSHRPPVQR